MSEVVYVGTVSNVTPVAHAFPVNDNTFMILEKLPTEWINDADRNSPDKGLIFAGFDSSKQFDDWGRGRIFNQTAELRWEQTTSDFQAVYIGPPVELPGLIADDTLNLAEAKQRESGYYLWGQRMSTNQLEDMNWVDTTATDIYVELKTPRVLRYPVQAEVSSRLKLQMVEYYDEQTDRLLMYRLKGVETA